MNDVLKDLMSMAPGLVMGLKGNDAGAAAFMDGWRQAEQQDHQRRRLQQHDQLALEDRTLAQQDRQRAIERQQAGDRYALEDRQRRQAIEGLQIPGTLAELGATADTPQDAQRIIESAIPNLMKVFGQETMAYGMPAVDMAQRVITGRQQKQVEAFVNDALSKEHIANNPDADPELIGLPEHITKILGKPTARLSELQRFAQLSVGRPARRPAEDVSWQIREGIGPDGKPGVFRINPKTGETQAVQGIRPEPPRAPSTIDGRSPAAISTFNQIASQYQRSPLTNAADRTIVLKDAAQAIREAPSNPANQMALAYSYIQALDTYQSAVREGELQNIGSLATMWQQLLVKANQVATTGAFMPPDVAIQIAEASDRLVSTIESGRLKKRAEFAARANASGVGDLWDQFMAGIPSSDPAPAPPPPGATDPAAGMPRRPVPSHAATNSQPGSTGGAQRPPAAQVGERRKFGNELREWNGSRWVLITPGQQ